MTKPLVIGVTGDIGSGKSVVCSVLHVWGYPVFDCDREAKALYDEAPELRTFMIRHFGSHLYATPSGLLNRALLADLIFSDAEALRLVEQKVHGLVTTRFEQWASEKMAKAIVVESAVLFKTQLPALCEAFIRVEAPLEERIERVIRRDQTSREALAARLACQKALPSYEGHKPLFLIHNSQDTPLLPQLSKILIALGLLKTER